MTDSRGAVGGSRPPHKERAGSDRDRSGSRTGTNDVESAVREALTAVRDPELDEDVVALGFVAGIAVDGEVVRVRLRLPTYFCAPNFAYLMVADARAAVEAVPGVGRAEVVLEDHFAAEEVTAGVTQGRGFADSFPGLAAGELDDLRQRFRRKAFIARQDRLCRRLLAEGCAAEQLTKMRLGDLPAGDETDVYVARRAELGFDVGPEAPLLVDDHGRGVPPDAARDLLRVGRTTRVSIDGNAGFCRGLLATRYGVIAPRAREEP